MARDLHVLYQRPGETPADRCRMVEHVDIHQQVARFAAGLPLLDARRAGIELYGAPRFNVFDVFEPGELGLTRVLEHLLDPGGAHGQGPLFLNGLLAALGLPAVGSGEHVRLRLEHVTRANRRVDLLIETPRLVLGIENKPWAAQLPNQLSDYLQELSDLARGGSYALVFLSNQEPRTGSGAVLNLRYSPDGGGVSLAEVLSRGVADVKAPRVAQFVHDLLGYLDWHFGSGDERMESDRPYVDAVLAEYDRGKEERRASAAFLLAAEHLHAKIIDEVERAVRMSAGLAANRVPGEDRLWDRLKAKKDPWRVAKRSWPANCFVAIESDRGIFRDVSYGVWALDPSSKEGKRFPQHACLSRKRMGSLGDVPGGETDDWCAWWMDAPTLDWGPEFAARLVLHAPGGLVGEHPEIRAICAKVEALTKLLDQTFP